LAHIQVKLDGYDSVIFLNERGSEISPITMIDKHVIGEGKIGPLIKRPSEIFFNIARGFAPTDEGWCFWRLLRSLVQTQGQLRT